MAISAPDGANNSWCLLSFIELSEGVQRTWSVGSGISSIHLIVHPGRRLGRGKAPTSYLDQWCSTLDQNYLRAISFPLWSPWARFSIWIATVVSFGSKAWGETMRMWSSWCPSLGIVFPLQHFWWISPGRFCLTQWCWRIPHNFHPWDPSPCHSTHCTQAALCNKKNIVRISSMKVD